MVDSPTTSTLTRSRSSDGLALLRRVPWARVATAEDWAMPRSVSMLTSSVESAPGSKMGVTETRDSAVYCLVDSRLKPAPRTTKPATMTAISFLRRPMAAT